MREVSVLKGLGYLTSTLSVVLLGIVAIETAERSPVLLACLVLGMIASIAGMLLRWRSHRLEQHEKDRDGARSPAFPPRAVRDSTTAHINPAFSPLKQGRTTDRVGK
ncbi:hypothetical protein Q9Q95_04585 [Sphingomonas sp. DG1-23]|uniref:hypothetical protein n=1 Tax=Sphingomonas sp. DG1-23 TaxID=3068316 RepID=UPI00273CFB11|nr:hypothetical protein [Sphingomonas sp. DG1-23]MDP5278191.1 hypothetical protein [Sphingomonas sp. DG1-23]